VLQPERLDELRADLASGGHLSTAGPHPSSRASVLPSNTPGGSPVRESRPPGSVRGGRPVTGVPTAIRGRCGGYTAHRLSYGAAQDETHTELPWPPLIPSLSLRFLFEVTFGVHRYSGPRRIMAHTNFIAQPGASSGLAWDFSCGPGYCPRSTAIDGVYGKR
jgi:hypothetical protein